MAVMGKLRLKPVDVLLVVLALPTWLFLIVTVPQGTGWGGGHRRDLMAPLALVGVTIVVHYVFRDRDHAWPLSAAIAGDMLTLILFGASWLNG